MLDLNLLLSKYIEMYCTSSNDLSFDFSATILQSGWKLTYNYYLKFVYYTTT